MVQVDLNLHSRIKERLIFYADFLLLKRVRHAMLWFKYNFFY